jgi:hypothetical protein
VPPIRRVLGEAIATVEERQRLGGWQLPERAMLQRLGSGDVFERREHTPQSVLGFVDVMCVRERAVRGGATNVVRGRVEEVVVATRRLPRLVRLAGLRQHAMHGLEEREVREGDVRGAVERDRGPDRRDRDLRPLARRELRLLEHGAHPFDVDERRVVLGARRARLRSEDREVLFEKAPMRRGTLEGRGERRDGGVAQREEGGARLGPEVRRGARDGETIAFAKRAPDALRPRVNHLDERYRGAFLGACQPEARPSGHRERREQDLVTLWLRDRLRELTPLILVQPWARERGTHEGMTRGG